MPETPDWSAAPQAVVSSVAVLLTALEAAAANLVGISSAGKRVVVIGVSLALATDLTGNYTARGLVAGIVADSLTSNAVGYVDVSPASPSAIWSPPPGSVILSVGADVQVQLGTTPGSGACFVNAAVSYYYVV